MSRYVGHDSTRAADTDVELKSRLDGIVGGARSFHVGCYQRSARGARSRNLSAPKPLKIATVPAVARMTADRLSGVGGGSRLTRPFLRPYINAAAASERRTGRPAPSAICFIACDAADANAALNNAKLQLLMNGYYWMFACLPQTVWGRLARSAVA